MLHSKKYIYLNYLSHRETARGEEGEVAIAVSCNVKWMAPRLLRMSPSQENFSNLNSIHFKCSRVCNVSMGTTPLHTMTKWLSLQTLTKRFLLYNRVCSQFPILTIFENLIQRVNFTHFVFKNIKFY